jgi:HK97 gp10 family phage protein
MPLRGAGDLEKLLRQLPDRVAKNVTFGAVRASARVIQRAARENLVSNPSVDTGALVAAIKVSTRRRSRKAPAVAAVGVDKLIATVVRKGRRSKKPMKINPRNYAHLVEFGTEHSAAEPFMRPAIDQHGEQALVALLDNAAKGIEREARKLAAGKTSYRTGRRIG